MARATTTVLITLDPARKLLPGKLILAGINGTFAPLPLQSIVDSSGTFSSDFVWSEALQTIEIQALKPLTVIASISIQVINGELNARARLKLYVNGSESMLQPPLFICNRAALVYSSISGSSNVQGQLNTISIHLEFNFEIVPGTVLTISGLLNTSTADNNQLQLEGGPGEAGPSLGYSGIWRRNTGTLVVTAIDSLNLNSRLFSITSQVQNGFSAKLTNPTIKLALSQSSAIGQCGGQICELEELESAKANHTCNEPVGIDAFRLNEIPTPLNFLTFQEIPQFIEFQVTKCMLIYNCVYLSHAHKILAADPGKFECSR